MYAAQGILKIDTARAEKSPFRMETILQMRCKIMSIFEWDDSIALGIPAIDRQHKVLFGWVNALDDSIVRGDGNEKVGETIVNLITYVTVHFSDEERLMREWGYPELGSHRKEHDYFVAKLKDIQASFNAGNDMSTPVLDIMLDWLVSHIKGTDQGYCRFIHREESKD
jgi:hemerythrin